MRKRAFLILLLALAERLSATNPTGDFVRFLISEIRARGGRTLEVQSLPMIEGSWMVERDEFGFQIHLFGVQFTTVDSFMTRILGEPKISTTKNMDGHPQRMYDRQVSGMHIQLVGKVDETYIVAVGPKKPKA